MPLDHPDLEPVWAAAQEYDLTISLHTFTVMPPYAPGGLDNWENLFLQRSAAHPWCGMRNMASLIGAGVMDRYPTLRIATLEAGHGWLPFWLARIDEHAKTIASEIPKLKHLPSEYAMSGRYFQSIEVPEGEKLTNAVMDLVGDGVLMYASDYPHGESHFPHTVEMAMDWNSTNQVRKQKLFWDNAVKAYPRAPVK
jgi:predicted TIM-barrel fold metal-dependent hydrolase